MQERTLDTGLCARGWPTTNVATPSRPAAAAGRAAAEPQCDAADRCVFAHSSHGKGITVYLTESEAQRPTLLLSVKQDRHTGLYFLL